MLKEIGFDSMDALFAHIPDQVKLKGLNLPSGVSEMEAMEAMETTA